MREQKISGRQKGVRTEQYNRAIQEYFSGNDSVSYIARKHNIDRSGLSRAVNSTKKSTLELLDEDAMRPQLKELVSQTLDNVAMLQKLTKDSLESLEAEVTKLRQEGKMDLNHLNQFLRALEKISNILGYSKNPIHLEQEASYETPKESKEFKIHFQVTTPTEEEVRKGLTSSEENTHDLETIIYRQNP